MWFNKKARDPLYSRYMMVVLRADGGQAVGVVAGKLESIDALGVHTTDGFFPMSQVWGIVSYDAFPRSSLRLMIQAANGTAPISKVCDPTNTEGAKDE